MADNETYIDCKLRFEDQKHREFPFMIEKNCSVKKLKNAICDLAEFNVQKMTIEHRTLQRQTVLTAQNDELSMQDLQLQNGDCIVFE